MGKKEFAIRRLLQLVVLYFLIATVLWVMFRIAPGSPMSNFISPELSQSQIREMERQFGLTRPWYVQYVRYLENVATLNFGFSYATLIPVREVIAGRIWNTIVLMATSLVFAYLIAVPMGAFVAWKRGTQFEQVGIIFAIISRSAPIFWTGIIAIYVLAMQTGIFPAGSMTTAGASYSGQLDMYLSVDFIYHLILPALVQAFYYVSLPMLLMRSSMLEVMNEDFVNFAKLKGISERSVIFKHAARNALLPVVTAFAIAAGYAIGGSVVVETVFAWPGIGRLMVSSVLANDYPVAQATFLLLAMLIVIANFLADLAYGYLDPRVTYD
jgi:peptide/nickel transport system permease protein